MIKREIYMQRIKPFIGKDVVKVLTGIRRAGKSVMLKLIQDELVNLGVSTNQFITFNFESISNVGLTDASLLYNEIVEKISKLKGTVYLFFDEIQEVKNWEKCINSLRVDFDCDIYITGSNANLLSSDLSTYLGGRYVEFNIYPFSFNEFIESKKQNLKTIDYNVEFKNYLRLGGMPFLTNINDNTNASLQYLNDLYNSVVLKDIVKRNNIRDIDLLERFINYIIANIGHTFSARSISNYFKSENRKVSVETILNYIKACVDAYLFFQVKREEIVGKKILSVNEKYYVVDHGIREAIFRNNKKDIAQVLENIIYLELMRRGYKVTVGKDGEKEIDFIAKQNDDIIYIQVAYLLASDDTINREFGVFSQIKDNYPKYVISLDEVDMSRNGIKHINIRDFLLMESW